MTANITAYLHKGYKSINLNGTEYNLGPDFVPPAENQTFSVAGGSSANRVNGGEAVSSARQDREWRFRVQVLGTSSMQIATNVQALINLVSQWGDDAEPLYLEYKGHTLPEPLWGQSGALMRYQVVHGDVQAVGNYYTIGNTRNKFTEVVVVLRVKPAALGAQQRLATASGAVIEDVLGMADGSSRGVIVLEATTNKMTNPVFGAATWNTGWTTQANVTSSKNTDPAFVFPGAAVSAKLTNKATGTSLFYQSINAGNTNPHFLTAYVIKHDRSAVTSSDVLLYYGSSKAATTFTAIGDGVYRLSVAVTGINAATTTGVNVLAKSTIYLLGMQLEELAYPTPLCWGDQLGCAWTSTAHASTSTRTAGRMTVPASEVYHSGQGTIAWAVKMPLVSTLQPTWVFWDMAGVEFRAYWQSSDAKFWFDDDTNAIASAASSFAAGDVLIFHATWSNSGLKLYLNGVEVATGATYTTPTIGTTFDIGRDEAGNPGGGAIMAWTAYDVAMTAAQVLAHYTSVAAVASAGRRIDYIPWLWTKDGDNILDNNTDASGGLNAPNANYAVVSGIPGNAEALTRYLMLPSTVNIKRVYLNRVLLDAGKYQRPDQQWYYDENTTATGTGDSGGAVLNVSGISTGYTQISSEITPADNNLMNNTLHIYMRAGPGTASGTISTQIIIGGATQFITINLATIVLPSSGKALYYLGSINVGQLGPFSGLVWALYGAAATSTNISVDFVMAISGDAAMIDLSYGAGALEVDGEFEVIGDSVRGYKSLTGLYGSFGSLIGVPIDLMPDKTNILICEGARGSNILSLGDTLTFTVDVTPRWSAL